MRLLDTLWLLFPAQYGTQGYIDSSKICSRGICYSTQGAAKLLYHSLGTYREVGIRVRNHLLDNRGIFPHSKAGTVFCLNSI